MTASKTLKKSKTMRTTKIQQNSDKALQLTNDGILELFFLGTGSAFSKRHNQNNLLVIKGQDHLLIDCGTKCPQALYSAGLPSFAVQNYLITHSHADHIGGLEEAALMGRYVTQKKPTIYITEEYQDILWQYSLMGGAAFNEKGFAEPLSFDDFFEVVRPKPLSGYPRDTYEIQIGSLNIKIMRTLHIPNIAKSWREAVWSTGALIDDRVLFTGDTLYDPDLIYDFDGMFGLEAIFHDCQFFTGGVHASWEELAQLSPNIKAKMYLTHYGDNWEEFEPQIMAQGFAGLAEQFVLYQFDPRQ